MNKEELKKLPLTAFNETSWLKPSLIIFANLIFMAKGILLFIASIASRDGGAKVLNLIYPEQSQLYIAIALSVIPLVTLVMLTIGEVEDYLKVKKALFIACSMQLAAEVSFSVSQLFEVKHFFNSPQVKVIFLQVILIICLLLSKRSIAYFEQLSKEKALLKEDS